MASRLIQPFTTETAYAQAAGLPQAVLYAAETVDGPAPVMFPLAKAGLYDLSALRYDFPAVTITTMRDVVVRGRSNILTPPDAIVRHGLMNLGTDLPAEEFYQRLIPYEGHGAAAWSSFDPFKVGYLPEAAAFTDATSFNYAHWITEVLPRIVAFAASPEHAAVPLIVDADLHPNIQRSIELAVGSDAILHRLAPEDLVRVSVLHNISATGYVPFKLRGQSSEGFSHGHFGPRALGDMVAHLRRAVPAGGGAERPRLFLRRQSTIRHLANEAEVEDALAGMGFVSIYPERLSLDEQIAIYSNAGMIVGATGAAIANLIYCEPDCPTVVIMPTFRATAYWYWRRMAAAAGAGPVLHVSGDQIDPLPDPYHPLALHRDFRVEVKDVLDAVEAAEALRP